MLRSRQPRGPACPGRPCSRPVWLPGCMLLTAATRIPQMLYRATEGRWLLPFVPVLRGAGLDRAAARGDSWASSSRWWTWRDRGERRGGAAQRRGEHRSADPAGSRRRPDRGGRPQADPVGGGVRRQDGARGDDAAAQHRGHRGRRQSLEDLRELVINEQYLAHPGLRGHHRPHRSGSSTCATCSSWRKTSASGARCAN